MKFFSQHPYLTFFGFIIGASTVAGMLAKPASSSVPQNPAPVPAPKTGA